MSTRDLIDAIVTGNSLGIESNFQAEITSRITKRLDEMQKTVAKNLFKESAEQNKETEELEEMAWGAARSKTGKKVEWHSMGDKHYVLKNGKPTHSGFLSHKDAAAEYKRHLEEDTELEETFNREKGINIDDSEQ